MIRFILAISLLGTSGCCLSPHWKNCSYTRGSDSERIAKLLGRKGIEQKSEWLGVVLGKETK